ncbi:LapA family protein [Motiliproteus sp. MSK22-1]|uniref:LapA family protein n=1 Tax=Motiliproteus sp. MSK22-1 TaxID=1897630 RepID=UPI0009F81C64|nr:LapA family protein [Motiliproteus sp. MSK22-1]
MRLIKTIIAVVLAVLLVMLGILLTVNNQQLVSIDLVFIQIPQASLARWLIASFLLGALVSMIFGSLAVVALKTRLRRANRQLNSSNRELDKLKTASIA